MSDERNELSKRVLSFVVQLISGIPSTKEWTKWFWYGEKMGERSLVIVFPLAFLLDLKLPFQLALVVFFPFIIAGITLLRTESKK